MAPAGRIDGLSVHEDTTVGWCEATPPNETTDDDGLPVFRDAGFSAGDPRAPRRRAHDDPGVVGLREHLRRHNGLPGLQVFDPADVDAAAEAFFRDGFVVVRDLLDADLLAQAREASTEALRRILAIAGVGGRRYVTETARLPHRYSYGTSSASRQLLHEPLWARLIDLDATRPLLARLFAGTDHFVRGAGGDLCLPGAIEYQQLHWDRPEPFVFPPGRLAAARAAGVDVDDPGAGAGIDPRLVVPVLERTPPKVTINFLMSDLTWENGPIRHVAGSHVRPSFPPTLADEPEWMRMSTLVGAPAGAGVFRDLRAWHGGTPNVSRQVRAMPNVEYSAGWDDRGEVTRAMPHTVWSILGEHGRWLCRHVVAPPGVWPSGAGVVHPLASVRRASSTLPAAPTGVAASQPAGAPGTAPLDPRPGP